MSENLMTTLQEKLGLAFFKKIDPNLSEGKKELLADHSTNHFTQAATIAVLVGIYKYSSSNEGAATLLNTDENQLLKKFFGDKEKDVINAVSCYGGREYETTRLLMQIITNETIINIKKVLGEHPNPKKIASYIARQRHNILVYLPPDLKLGSLINDDTIDDATNKMEGPVSSLMHFFENFFAQKS